MLPKQQLLRKGLLVNILYIIHFDKKAVELIKILQILNHPDVIETLPEIFKIKKNIPMKTCQSGNTLEANY